MGLYSKHPSEGGDALRRTIDGGVSSGFLRISPGLSGSLLVVPANQKLHHVKAAAEKSSGGLGETGRVPPFGTSRCHVEQWCDVLWCRFVSRFCVI